MKTRKQCTLADPHSDNGNVIDREPRVELRVVEGGLHLPYAGHQVRDEEHLRSEVTRVFSNARECKVIVLTLAVVIKYQTKTRTRTRFRGVDLQQQNLGQTNVKINRLLY